MTHNEIRQQFWAQMEELEPWAFDEYKKSKKHNDYSTTVRVIFCDYIDYLFKDGQITSAQKNRITL
jgi:hypothetical protein